MLLLLQHTIDGVQDGPLVLQLIGGLTAHVRPRLQQLLQRSAGKRHTTTNTSNSRYLLSGVDGLQLSAEVECLGAAAAAAAEDRRGLAVLFCSSSESKSS